MKALFVCPLAQLFAFLSISRSFFFIFGCNQSAMNPFGAMAPLCTNAAGDGNINWTFSQFPKYARCELQWTRWEGWSCLRIKFSSISQKNREWNGEWSKSRTTQPSRPSDDNKRWLYTAGLTFWWLKVVTLLRYVWRAYNSFKPDWIKIHYITLCIHV